MSGTVQRAAETAATERYEAVLRVSQTLISVRPWEKFLSIFARELRAVANFCYLGAAIYDEKALLAADLDGPYEIHPSKVVSPPVSTGRAGDTSI
jgi:hypothetical protein